MTLVDKNLQYPQTNDEHNDKVTAMGFCYPRRCRICSSAVGMPPFIPTVLLHNGSIGFLKKHCIQVTTESRAYCVAP